MVPAVSAEIKEALIKNIRRRMTPQPLKIRADIEMKCFQFDGVLHIQVSLRSVLALFFSRGDVPSIGHEFSLNDHFFKMLLYCLQTLPSDFAGRNAES